MKKLLLVVLMVFAPFFAQAMDPAPGVSLLVNDSFVEGLAGWTLVGPPEAARQVSPGFPGITTRLEGKWALALGGEVPGPVQLSQDVTLPDGRYGLKLRVRRSGTSPAWVRVTSGPFNRSVSVPLAQELDTWLVDYTQPFGWLQLVISDIQVRNQTCQVLVRFEGAGQDRLLVDEVWLYRY